MAFAGAHHFHDFLCILPSTVQSSIALTAMARGNVPAAICAASLSNMLGVLLTPMLAALLLSAGILRLNVNSALWICVQLLVPFVMGQFMRPLLGGWIERNKALTLLVDRGSILLIVYSAFSAGMAAGIWRSLDAYALFIVVVGDLTLLLVVLLVIARMGRIAKLSDADQLSFLFCGSQKSLASGVPIANILFVGHTTSMIILPLMLYHQFQLLVSAAIARRHEERRPA